MATEMQAAVVEAFRAPLAMRRLSMPSLGPGEIPAPLFDIVTNCVTVRGSFIGTRQDVAESLAFAAACRVRTGREPQTLPAINAVPARLEHGDAVSRMVLRYGDT